MTSLKHLFRCTRALLAFAALLPAMAFAQVSAKAVEVMNIRFIELAPHFQLSRTTPGKWVLSNGSVPYDEVKRTDTTISLRPAAGQPGSPLFFDFATNLAYWDLEPRRNNGSILATSAASGTSVGQVDVELSINGTTLPVKFLANGGTDLGWTTYRTGTQQVGTQLSAAAVRRDARTITFTQNGQALTVDVVGQRCSYPQATCKVVKVYPVNAKEVGHIKFGNGGREILTITQTSTTNWREERPDGSVDLREIARTHDYVELQYVGGRKQRFYVDGRIMVDWTGSGGWGPLPLFAVANMEHRWPGQLGTTFAPVSPGISPGFQIQNKTDYPVLVTLEQVGCLYYGIVQPGQVFQRNTGAVWFTIKASMAPDLREPTVESCIRKPAMYAATVVVAGITAATTGGIGATLVVPAMLITAAGQGAAYGTQAAMTADGATATEAMAGKVGVTTLVRGAMAFGFAMIGNPAAAGPAVLEAAVAGAALIAGTELYTRYTEPSDFDGFKGQLTQEASIAGAYAGYAWPWPMKDRVMPRYDITGGPRIKKLQDGTTVFLLQEHPLTITKVN